MQESIRMLVTEDITCRMHRFSHGRHGIHCLRQQESMPRTEGCLLYTSGFLVLAGSVRVVGGHRHNELRNSHTQQPKDDIVVRFTIIRKEREQLCGTSYSVRLYRMTMYSTRARYHHQCCCCRAQWVRANTHLRNSTNQKLRLATSKVSRLKRRGL